MASLTDIFNPVFFADIVENSSVCSFFGENYPALFLRELEAKVKDRVGEEVVSFAISNEQSLATFIQAAQVSFLGQRRWYLVKEVPGLDVKTSKLLLSYITNYKGPHCLFYYSSVVFSSSFHGHRSITIPKSLSVQDYKLLYSWIYGQEVSSIFIQSLFCSRTTVTLEQACLLMRYQRIVGKNTEEFLDMYLPLLIKKEENLFLLSQYFFAKESDLFFSALGRLESVYPTEFWIAFWFEQMWQSLVFVDGASRIGPIAAKSLVNRLPFSFIQKDWKRYTVNSLAKAHNELCVFDWSFKNGTSELGLHSWYIDFLFSSKKP